MTELKVTDTILYIGTDDKTLDLFESQYTIPNGVSYNSYLILDEKIAVMDTVDERKTDDWFDNLEMALDGRKPDYLIVSHMEPDHAANIKLLAEKYPGIQIVGNAKTFTMINQFFEMDLDDRKVLVKEGENLSLGEHTLQFFMAPMVHWPEVMVTYEQKEKILFSADAFGKFSTLDIEEEWTCEARRYYFNIVGKYGVQVQALLKKAADLDIEMICPLHGPVLKEDLGYYIGKYNTWSSYVPEDEGVLIAVASIYGNTVKAAYKLKEMLEAKGVKQIAISELARDDQAEAVEDAFRYSHLVLMSSTYDGGLFPCMEKFLHHLKTKNFQNRKAALIENGSWAPMAGKHMKAILEGMKNIAIYEPLISIKSVMKDKTIVQMDEMIAGFAEELLD